MKHAWCHRAGLNVGNVIHLFRVHVYSNFDFHKEYQAAANHLDKNKT